MKLHLHYKLLFIVLISGMYSLSAAQAVHNIADITEEDENWVNIKSLPLANLPKGVFSYFFYSLPDSSHTVKLYTEGKEGKLSVVKSWKEECLFNPKKSDNGARYVDGEVFLCSKLPSVSTYVCCVFDFSKGNEPTLKRMDITDSGSDLLYTADSLLAAGDISGAIKTYKKIVHPTHYMNMLGKGIEILEVAHPLAEEAFAKKNYEKAVSIMQTALSFEPLWVIRPEAFNSLLELEKYEKSFWKANISIGELLEIYTLDYGKYLYHSKKLVPSIEVNAYLATVLVESPLAPLRWADALYDLNEKGMAKHAYEMYLKRLRDLDIHEEEIEQRAIQRME